MTVDQAPVRARRLRTARTGWTGLVVVAALVVGGGLLYDAVAVRTGHRARPWRAETADRLATVHLDDPVVQISAGAAVLIGALLLGLAVAPGMRRWLPLRQPGAVIDRAGVAALLTRRARQLDGVSWVKIKVRRARTRVTVAGPADPAEVQRELRTELARVPLAGEHRLDVRTGRARR
ncbi:hypothetical protein F4556_001764 [Kitasatospora gansuensis]|uniref:DUF6286 domain-containing protein n=1 Tax=Kitasatospora gansuensis TaxID=258050 RepID=A0A7W7WH64_9ACTN|nr:DUF6286 domain-containing protein [Kitasatospora gansuensis]MBB4946229.1 hypothetical protein [Kitasatospora gansuensis]